MTSVPKPKRITVAVLNYIPFLSGFYANMLDVLKACLGSIWANTDLEYDLLVFDNGSCAEVKDYLVDMQSQGKIQYLILSEKNIGKGGAWNIILEGAPGEIIAYADNDVYFYPGWLSRSVKVLETYPNVGMVTARAFRTNPEFISRTLEWAEKTPGVKLEKGSFIPFEKYLEFNLSLGSTKGQITTAFQETEDFLLTYRNLVTYAGASHWQFVAFKSILRSFLPFDMTKPMGEVKQLDQRMNANGYLRLMINDFLAMNMSNTPTVDQKRMLESSGQNKRSNGFLESPLVKKVLLKIYDKIFEWYYKTNH